MADAYDREYVAGATVVRKGEPASSWIGVASGLLKVSAVNLSQRQGRDVHRRT
jgi:hypothetical protein